MKDFAIELAATAGHILKHYYEAGFQVEQKSTAVDMVTQADVESEQAVVQAIRQRYPDHAVLGEEGGQQGNADYLWVIDPLDGTTNFVHRHPMFCVTLGLLYRGEVILGVTLDPLRDELFVAERNRGATLNGQPIHVSETQSLEAALVATGFPYDRQTNPAANMRQFGRIMPQVQGIRRSGSTALDMAYVACGRLDGYWELYTNPWDWLAGTLLVSEAGGIATDVAGIPPSLSSRSVLSGNPDIHSLLAPLVR